LTIDTVISRVNVMLGCLVIIIIIIIMVLAAYHRHLLWILPSASGIR